MNEFRVAGMFSRHSDAKCLGQQRAAADACQSRTQFPACYLCVMVSLYRQPPSVAEAEVATKQQVGLCINGAFARDDLVDTCGGNVDQ